MTLFRLMRFRQIWLASAFSLCAIAPAFGGTPRLGESRPFWVRGNPKSYRKTLATLASTGTHSLIYVEDRIRARIAPEFLEQLKENLENSTPEGSVDKTKGIIPLLESLFSPLPRDFSTDARLRVLVADLGPGKDGFYNPYDSMREGDAAAWGEHSNQMNLVYVSDKKNLPELGAVIARQLQRLLNQSQTRGFQDTWLTESLGEAAELAAGYYTSQAETMKLAQSPDLLPLVSFERGNRAPRALFGAYILDFIPEKTRVLSLLNSSASNGRQAVENLLRAFELPASFEVLFSNFVGYVFENEGNALPYSLTSSRHQGLVMPPIEPYVVLKSFPVEVMGSLMPYSFLAIDLPAALPLTSVVEVEARREGAKPGSCAQTGTVLWKPIHPRRIAIYAVGCEHHDASDALQFRLRVFDKPLLPKVSPGKIAP